MAWLVSILLALLHNLIHFLLVPTAQVLCTFKAEVHEISSIGFTPATHTDVSGFSCRILRTSITLEAVVFAFCFDMRLDVGPEPLDIYVALLNNQDRILQHWVLIESACFRLILKLCTVDASM